MQIQVENYSKKDASAIALMIVEILASPTPIKMSVILQLLETAENVQECFNSLDTFSEEGFFNLLITRALTFQDITEEDITALFSQYAKFSNLNIPNEQMKTTLHRIAENNFESFAEFIFGGMCECDIPFAFYALDNQQKTPFELAGPETETFFKEAMEKEAESNPDLKEHLTSLIHKKSMEKNFLSRIILVTSFATDSVFNYLLEHQLQDIVRDKDDNMMPKESVAKALVSMNGLITDDGTIGSHLSFEKNIWSTTFVDRPHTHWSWNQLCHANSGGGWEMAEFAVMEPLSCFKNVEGIAPFDTTIMGPHCLSAQSVILVPNAYVKALTQRLKQSPGTFQGSIKGYPSHLTLRQAVKLEMENSFSNAAKLRNAYDNDISKMAFDSQNNPGFHERYDFKFGCFEFLKIEIDGLIEPLMKTVYPSRLQAPVFVPLHPLFKEYTQGRHLGLHADSASDVEKIPAMINLNELSKEPWKISANMPCLFGSRGQKNQVNLCSVVAFNAYKKLMHYKEETGAHAYARYLLKKAIIADFRAYHAGVAPSANVLTVDQLKPMVESSFDKCLAFLEQNDAAMFGDINSRADNYRAILKASYDQVLAPKKSLLGSGENTIWSKPPVAPLLANEINADRVREEGDVEMGDNLTPGNSIQQG